jgi:hypothetical protein
VEMPQQNSIGDKIVMYSAVGLTIPLIKVTPVVNSALKLPGLSKTEPLLCVIFKKMVLYCDYDSTSYTNRGNDAVNIASEFKSRWAGEIHTAMLLPLDISIYVAAELLKSTDLLSTKLAFEIGQMNFAVDSRQIQVLQELLDLQIHHERRLTHLVRVRGIFGKKWLPPRINEVGGIHIFPCLTIQHKQYPNDPTALPPAEQSLLANAPSKLIPLLKSRLGPNWAKVCI